MFYNTTVRASAMSDGGVIAILIIMYIALTLGLLFNATILLALGRKLKKSKPWNPLANLHAVNVLLALVAISFFSLTANVGNGYGVENEAIRCVTHLLGKAMETLFLVKLIIILLLQLGNVHRFKVYPEKPTRLAITTCIWIIPIVTVVVVTVVGSDMQTNKYSGMMEQCLDGSLSFWYLPKSAAVFAGLRRNSAIETPNFIQFYQTALIIIYLGTAIAALVLYVSNTVSSSRMKDKDTCSGTAISNPLYFFVFTMSYLGVVIAQACNVFYTKYPLNEVFSTDVSTARMWTPILFYSFAHFGALSVLLDPLLSIMRRHVRRGIARFFSPLCLDRLAETPSDRDQRDEKLSKWRREYESDIEDPSETIANASVVRLPRTSLYGDARTAL